MTTIHKRPGETWRKFIVRVERAKADHDAAVDATMPDSARGGSASELLYGDDVHQDPLGNHSKERNES